MTVADELISVHDLIGNGIITAHFQPLISVKKRSIVGLEALARCTNPLTGERIPPDLLFRQAASEGIVLELDRFCRQKAFENFLALRAHNPDLLLFLNFDTAIIDDGVVGSNYLLHQVERMGLTPNTVAIEIIESRVQDHHALQRFVDTYRDYGFIIVLDDVGSGHSNLDRIPLLKPDVLKIDRSLLTNIHQEYYKQVVFKSLANLARNIGALVVAEGMENEEEAIMALEFGADLLQGFYFSRPQEANWETINGACRNIDEVAAKYRSAVISQVRKLKSRSEYYDTLIASLVCELSNTCEDNIDVVLNALVSRYHSLECIYVLDNQGMQISDTVSALDRKAWQRKAYFRPARRGTDHSLKEYYYLLVNTSVEKCTTDPYISMASGNPCVTMSTLFLDADGKERILCIDANPE